MQQQDKKALDENLREIAKAAEVSSARLKKAREDHEEGARRLLAVLSIDPSTSLGSTIRTGLDTAFLFGQVAGESTETSAAYQEQLALIRQMSAQAEEVAAKSEERAKQSAEREERQLALLERQVKAIEALGRTILPRARSRAKGDPRAGGR